MRYLIVILALLISSQALAEKAGMKDIIADQMVSKPIEYSISKLFNFLPIKYWYNLIQSNRVHSATTGKGFVISIPELEKNVTLYADPINTAGYKRQLFKHNTLFKGKYRLTSSKGTKAGRLTITRNTSIDYLKVLAVTGTKSDLNFGRLTLEVVPKNASVSIKGYPEKYRKGMRIPEGQYQLIAKAEGYNDKSAQIEIKHNKNNHFKISLAKKNKVVAKAPVKQAVQSAPVIAKKSNEAPARPKITIPAPEEPKKKEIDPLKPVSLALSFNWKSRQRDKLTLTLENNEGHNYKQKGRIRGKDITLNMQLPPGEYKANLLLHEKGRYNLGKIKVLAGKDNEVTKYLQ